MVFMILEVLPTDYFPLRVAVQYFYQGACQLLVLLPHVTEAFPTHCRQPLVVILLCKHSSPHVRTVFFSLRPTSRIVYCTNYLD
jgi:hypothetical protein